MFTPYAQQMTRTRCSVLIRWDRESKIVYLRSNTKSMVSVSSRTGNMYDALVSDNAKFGKRKLTHPHTLTHTHTDAHTCTHICKHFKLFWLSLLGSYTHIWTWSYQSGRPCLQRLHWRDSRHIQLQICNYTQTQAHRQTPRPQFLWVGAVRSIFQLIK